MILKLSRGITILVVMIAGCVVMIVGVALYCTVLSGASGELDPPDVSRLPPPSDSPMGTYTSGAVVSNSGPCARVGNQILDKYGSAVDAVIATMICDGVGCLQNMGLGGGFLMTLYKRSTGEVTTLNARETAPAAATHHMFSGQPKMAQYGGLSVGVPGELRGYEAAYRMWGGKAPWPALFQGTIDLCREGFPVDKHMAGSLSSYEKEIRNSKILSSVMLNEEGELLVEGDLMKLPLLADTLDRIASGGADELYNGSLTQGFVQDIREAGGIITEHDMASYSVRWEKPVSVKLSGGQTLYSSPPPGSGPVLGLIMKLLDGRLPSGDTLTDTQRVTEAFKLAYARRTQLGDPHFTDVSQVLKDLQSEEYIKSTRERIWDNVTHQEGSWYGSQYLVPEDHGTANIVVLAPNGDAVVATSTINLIFGSKLMSKSTGILLNNEMDDFSSPSITNYFGLKPSEANLIVPGKRPLSSMCPTIVLGPDGSVRLAVGAAGGTKITTATALVAINNLWYNKTIKESIDAPRYHHQLYPMTWQYEYGTPKRLVDGMRGKGHTTTRQKPALIGSCTTAVEAPRAGTVRGYSDPRRPGSVAGVVPVPEAQVQSATAKFIKALLSPSS